MSNLKLLNILQLIKNNNLGLLQKLLTNDLLNESLISYAICYNSDISVIKTLIKAGCDINKKELKNHFTPLIFAIINSNEKAVETLLKNGADVNIRTKNNFTPIMYARKKVIKILFLCYQKLFKTKII
jgi:ankyrin repeat protein